MPENQKLKDALVLIGAGITLAGLYFYAESKGKKSITECVKEAATIPISVVEKSIEIISDTASTAVGAVTGTAGAVVEKSESTAEKAADPPKENDSKSELLKKKSPNGIIQRVMHEFKHEELKSHGEIVTKKKQAVAIAMSEAGISKKSKKKSNKK